MLSPALQPLLEHTVAAFAQLVEQDPRAHVWANLLDTVRAIVAFVAALGLALIQTYVDVRFRQTKATHRTCSCGEPMEWLANSAWPHGTPFGEVQVRDAYAYCRTCHKSARPLHGWLGTGVERFSLELEEQVVDLAADESCGKAVAKLARQHPGVEVERTSALRILLRHGARARAFVAQKLAGALQAAATEGQRTGATEIEVEFDGGMIPVATLEPIPPVAGQAPERTAVRGLLKRRKDCRWEEAKLGLVQIPGEVDGRLYTVRPTAELDESFADLLALACLKGWTETTQVRGIADGARHIRPRLADAFHASPFHFILDRPHAKEHLAAAGAELEAQGGVPKAVWADAALAKLEVGEALQVVAELRLAANRAPTDVLRLEADYFDRNQDAVLYQHYREQGWSTASSEVESGHRSVVQVRLKLPGTWWHPDNVKYILALRMIRANGWWPEYWEQQRHHWRERARELRTTHPRTQIAAAA
jgi:hypothetical protein